ncbi:MAG TPA: hypothetical protein VEC57_20795 [Candidatus Limnocylindrales bacterium]|nr:hypothetical protein [Candidatus Limnocylindrales bacterium]
MRYERSSSIGLTLPLGKAMSIPQGNLPWSKDAYHCRMENDLAAIRRKKLELLIEQAGSAVALAERVTAARAPGAAPLSESYVSRMRKGIKPISGDMATELEAVMGKMPGWMSNPNTENDDSKGQKYWPFSVPPETYERLSDSAKRKADELLSTYMVGLATREIVPSRPVRKKKQGEANVSKNRNRAGSRGAG